MESEKEGKPHLVLASMDWNTGILSLSMDLVRKGGVLKKV